MPNWISKSRIHLSTPIEKSLGVNFTNVLCAAFTLVGPKSAKWHCWIDCIFLSIRNIRALKLYIERWWNCAMVSISSWFYEQLLCAQIPKVQKRLTTWLSLCMLLGCTRVKAVRRMLMNWPQDLGNKFGNARPPTVQHVLHGMI